MMNFNFPMVEIPFPDIPVYILFYFSKADGHLYSKFGDLKPPMDEKRGHQILYLPAEATIANLESQ